LVPLSGAARRRLGRRKPAFLEALSLFRTENFQLEGFGSNFGGPLAIGTRAGGWAALPLMSK